MFSHSHLALQAIQLESPQEWVADKNKLLFLFPKAGRGHYISPAIRHRLVPGDVLILNPTCEGHVCAEDGGKFAFSFFTLGPEHVFPLFTSREIRLLHNVCESFKATKLHGSATILAREWHKLLMEVPAEFGLEHRGQLLRVVAAILGAEFKTAQPHHTGFVRAEDHLMRVLASLSSEQLMRLSVGELAARFGCSKRHLSRLFHQHFGFSVVAMKMEIRLLKSVSLLRDPDIKIISVAEQCGFNNLGLFNACFKKRFGVTPSQRRKTMTEAEGQPAQPIEQLTCPLSSNGLCLGSINPDNRPPPPKAGAEEIRKVPAKRLVIAVKPLDAVKGPERAADRLTERSIRKPRVTSQHRS